MAQSVKHLRPKLEDLGSDLHIPHKKLSAMVDSKVGGEWRISRSLWQLAWPMWRHFRPTTEKPSFKGKVEGT